MRSDASTQVGYDPTVVTAVVDWLLASLHSHQRTVSLIGLSGLQGSGKSTLARQLVIAANTRGVASEFLALDDFYLGRRDRMRLAREVHPLLATRGVPGTHDLNMLHRTLRELAHANAQRPVLIPRFDKGRDTRWPPSRWRAVTTSPKLVLLEGWCVGVPAQAGNVLARPLNGLERNEDSDGRWRRWVNRQLAAQYTRLWQQMHGLILLEAPDFAVASRWRGEPERVLRASGAPRAMDRSALRRFVMHYERLSRHALRVLPARADLRIVLRSDRSVRRLRAQD